MPLAYITHSRCRRHNMGTFHPEQPARLDAINDRLHAKQLSLFFNQYDAPKASREQLLRVHDGDYLDHLESLAPSEGLAWIDGDTAMCPDTMEAALHAAGAVVHGIDLVMQGKARCAFCAVRPPGHHAERNKAMGFCFFNNIAVGAAHALATYDLRRIAIVDFDVHHGNGTEDIFEGNQQVLCCSSYQHPFYPHTGGNSEASNIIDIPLPAGTGSESFRDAISNHMLPVLEEYSPELIMISAGFDAHRDDDMGQFNLLEGDYGWVTKQLMDVAARHAQGRIVSALEGGYDLFALSRSVTVHMESLMDDY